MNGMITNSQSLQWKVWRKTTNLCNYILSGNKLKKRKDWFAVVNVLSNFQSRYVQSIWILEGQRLAVFFFLTSYYYIFLFLLSLYREKAQHNCNIVDWAGKHQLSQQIRPATDKTEGIFRQPSSSNISFNQKLHCTTFSWIYNDMCYW